VCEIWAQREAPITSQPVGDEQTVQQDEKKVDRKPYDESTFPPKMVTMAEEALKTTDQVIMNSPFHRHPIVFNKKPQTPYCKYCRNGLVVKADDEAYIQTLYLGYCNKCNKVWQVCL
jgi:hypothetical protein